MIWYRDPTAAFASDQLHRFLPTPSMTVPEQLNAIVRLAAYYAVAVVALTRSTRPLGLLAVVAGVTVAVNEARERSSGVEGFGFAPVAACVPPSRDNPFMNLSLNDMRFAPARPAACDATDPAVQAQIAGALSPMPTDDHFAMGRTDRQFYTMPCTTAANRQVEFADWLYKKDGKTAKGY
jgi:hypothetical protein